MITGGFGAIIVDDPAMVADCDRHSDDKRVVFLDHPLEFDIIERYGLTYGSASLTGRFLVYEEQFCKSCGNVYETRKLGTSSLTFGCLLPIVTALIIGLVLGLIQSSPFQGVLGAWLALPISWLVIDWITGVYVRIRFAKRASQFRIGRGCPKCGSLRIAHGGTLPCPKCAQRTMKVTSVGMS